MGYLEENHADAKKIANSLKRQIEFAEKRLKAVEKMWEVGSTPASMVDEAFKSYHSLVQAFLWYQERCLFLHSAIEQEKQARAGSIAVPTMQMQPGFDPRTIKRQGF